MKDENSPPQHKLVVGWFCLDLLLYLFISNSSVNQYLTRLSPGGITNTYYFLSDIV